MEEAIQAMERPPAHMEAARTPMEVAIPRDGRGDPGDGGVVAPDGDPAQGDGGYGVPDGRPLAPKELMDAFSVLLE